MGVPSSASGWVLHTNAPSLDRCGVTLPEKRGARRGGAAPVSETPLFQGERDQEEWETQSSTEVTIFPLEMKENQVGIIKIHLEGK